MVTAREHDEGYIVDRLGELQRYKLRLNRHKGSWHTDDVWELVSLLQKEVTELGEALRLEDFDGGRLECADIANFCAMIVDVLDGRVPDGE